jgi:hypothetical protein
MTLPVSARARGLPPALRWVARTKRLLWPGAGAGGEARSDAAGCSAPGEARHPGSSLGPKCGAPATPRDWPLAPAR